MRKEINILWLDDNAGEDLDLIQKVFCSVLDDCGYKAVLIICKSYDEAETRLNEKSIRIDFFVSDYNLDEEKNGLDFLIDVRKKEKFKEFFVLYSNSTKDRMRKGVKDLIIRDNENVDFFNNYYFFSTGPDFNKQSIKSNFQKVVSLSLVRWNELNALRGEYASINTLLEWTLRNIFKITDSTFYDKKPNYKDYANCVRLLSSKIGSELKSSLKFKERQNIFKKWSKLRKNRNVLEHNIEKWDPSANDFIIEKNDHSIRFVEKDINKYRKELIGHIVLIKKLLDDLFLCNSSIKSVQSSNAYQNLIKGIN